jgi:hypothetical protein
VTVAWENVVCIVHQESLIATGVDEAYSKLLNTDSTAMIVQARKSSNIVAANLEEPSLTFFISGMWQSYVPPQEWRIGCLV